MDLEKSIKDLRIEKDRLDKAISILETLLAGGDIDPRVVRRSPRGRKSMSAEERRVVSQRMKEYWDKRRTAKEKVHK